MLGLGRDDLLFPSNGRAGGRPLSRNTFRTRVWLPALALAGLDFHVRFHDLRHAHASWALAGGADLKAVMDRLGHAQITTTQRYLHTLPESDDQALSASVIGPANPTSAATSSRGYRECNLSSPNADPRLCFPVFLGAVGGGRVAAP
jgi:Phage integrase family